MQNHSHKERTVQLMFSFELEICRRTEHTPKQRKMVVFVRTCLVKNDFEDVLATLFCYEYVIHF